MAWIDSKVPDNDIDRIIRFKARNSDEIKTAHDDWIFGVRDGTFQSIDGGVRKGTNNEIFISNNGRGYYNVEYEYEVELGNSYYALNGKVTSTQARHLTSKTIGIYWNNGAVAGNQAFRGSFAYFDIGDLHLTPAILARDIFPTEDANGIARFKGEAVMVDKKKYLKGEPCFFGNIAKTGAFGVSDE